jgi:glucose-6-phosphate isomerase
VDSVELSLDISRMNFDERFIDGMENSMQKAYRDMDDLERGALSNPDENRIVGHYWLRAPELAPSPQIRDEINNAISSIKDFSAKIHQGIIKPPRAKKFTHILSIGIGGSALGPMFVSEALGHPLKDKMKVFFFDNTDPDGFEKSLAYLNGELSQTLCIVISKSGGTPETRNGMIYVSEIYKDRGLDFAGHAVAITQADSQLDIRARKEGWLARFPMWDWVGGRTSELSAVGLLPAALQGLNIDEMLEGARLCDRSTRRHEIRKNPAALMALMWHLATEGKGKKDMVILPYKDCLIYLARYLQQLVMESLGKRCNLKGEVVEQGISVFGNKGSTDQHAYIQQLREGVNNFFAVFIRVLESGGTTIQVGQGITPGDYLHSYLLGTRDALFENRRQSLTITVRKVDARTIGALIALFERAVGFYASLVGINAYHQPGVEAGKKMATSILALQSKVEQALGNIPKTIEELAEESGEEKNMETIFHILEYLEANGRAKILFDSGEPVYQSPLIKL